MTTPSQNLLVWKRRLPGLIMSAPAVIVFVAMFIVPMGLAVVLSLTNWNGYSLNLNFIGFENYLKAFSNPRTIDAAVFTLKIAFFGTLFCNAIGLGIAALISGPGKPNVLARTVFFYPYTISALIIGFLWSAMLAPQGVVNNLLSHAGMAPLPFLTEPSFAQATVVATVVWSHFGFNMILYIAGLKSIPAEYYEASTIDGASRWDQFRYITFPMLAPIVTVNLVLSLVGFLKVYEVALALTAGGPAGSTQTIVFQILSDSFANGKLGFGAAQSVILLVVTAVLGLAVTLSRRGAERKVTD